MQDIWRRPEGAEIIRGAQIKPEDALKQMEGAIWLSLKEQLEEYLGQAVQQASCTMKDMIS